VIFFYITVILFILAIFIVAILYVRNH